MIVGDWHSELHEEAVFRALQELGHEPIRFAWHKYFKRAGALAKAFSAYFRAQNKYLFGPVLTQLNRDLVRMARSRQPDAIFIYRGTHVLPETLPALRVAVPNAVLVGYNNDDPFAPGHIPGLWRHFVAGLPELDMALAYRHANLDDFRRAGARRVELLRSWYIRERNHPVVLAEGEQARHSCDVVFVGHFEPDHRLGCLEAIANEGWRLRLRGPGYEWDKIVRHSEVLRPQLPVHLVWGEEYNRALCGAKIALCFLSKLNRDTYTRRCFEIPATGTMMLAEYTEDLATLFREGEEVEFFRSQEEMMEKIAHYLSDDVRRLAVAEAGHRRVVADGHDVVSRMRQVVKWVAEIREKAP